MLSATLLRNLRAHRDDHAPVFPPHGHSDHGPMAMLALAGLGATDDTILRFGASYRARLAPQLPASRSIDGGDWFAHRHRPESYAALLAYFDACIAADGWQATVARCLPQLASGWVRNAFHPLIRLAYGIEFGVASEIAAGLAYLTISGPDPALAQHARRGVHAAAAQYLAAMQAQYQPRWGAGTFGERYAGVVAHSTLQPAAGEFDDVLRGLGRACLQVFDAGHDFFALHMLTGSHAFRVCARWIGPDAVRLYSVGIGAAYLVIGAPAFGPLGDGDTPSWSVDAVLRSDDEHDIKFAYSCSTQSRVFGDPAYMAVAAKYLGPRTGRAG